MNAFIRDELNNYLESEDARGPLAEAKIVLVLSKDKQMFPVYPLNTIEFIIIVFVAASAPV